ncbi:MAG: DUF4369 domain-containing protein [Chitinophagaceae bacterium]
MANNKKFFSLICFLLLVSKLVGAQQQNGFTIDGNIEGLVDGEKMTLVMANSNGLDENSFDMLRTDSGYSKNGRFHISGFVPEGPRYYWLIFDKHADKIIELFINNNEQIKLESGDMKKIPHNYIQHYVKIEGSPTHYGMMCLNPILVFYNQSISRINHCIRNVKDSMGFNGPVIEAFIKARDEVNQALYFNILAGGRDPEIEKASIFLSSALYLKSGHASFWPDLYNMLSETEKNSFYGKLLKEKIKLCVGQPFPEFTLSMLDGKMLSLKEVVSKGKITIVQFWAKNSIERKDYQGELLGLYKKYHYKGLNVIGFSTDKYKDEWAEALQESKFSWYNVGDQRGVNGIAKTVYHEYSTDFDKDLFIHNTTNVVLDAEGKILAWDVRGAELQYYLWKAMGE